MEQPPAPPDSIPSATRRGVLAVLPLLAGAVPFAVAFALTARAAGFSLWETQALSMLVFAGSAQLAVVALVGGGAGALAVVATAAVLNLRHVLYGMALGRDARFNARLRPPLPLLAAVVTDESFGLTVRAARTPGGGGPAFLWGASAGLYLPFALATLGGSLLGDRFLDPTRLGLDVVFPLSFLALLLPLLSARRQILVAGVAGVAALILSRIVPGGVTVLLATILAATLGALLDRPPTATHP